MTSSFTYQLQRESRSYVMIRLLFACCFFFFLPFGRMDAQVSPDRKKHDFGTVERTTDRVADITFTNEGAKDAFILTTRVPRGYTYLWSERSIPAGGTATLRVKFNPIEKGSYNDALEVYFSSMQDPVILRFRAEVEYIDRSDNPACPSFREVPGQNSSDEPFTVKVIDRMSREPLHEVRVRIVQQGRLQRDVRTDRKGLYSEQVPIGYYLIIADADGYLSADSSGYINRRNDYIVFELEKDPDAAKEEPLADEATPEPEPEQPREEITIITGGVPEPEPAPEPEPEPIVVTSTELPEDRYARNSVVFLLDVSQSMKQKGKLELLQAAMLRMISALRPIDQVALISYASETIVVLDMTSADRKAELEKAVAALEAGGMTAGARGFQGAYDMALDHFIDDANNQVIVTTDGAFTQRDRPRIIKMAEKYHKKSVKTSVVGVRSKSYADEVLLEIAEAGEGSFIKIEDFDLGQEALIEEIRKQSYIKR